MSLIQISILCNKSLCFTFDDTEHDVATVYCVIRMFYPSKYQKDLIFYYSPHTREHILSFFIKHSDIPFRNNQFVVNITSDTLTYTTVN